MTSAAAPVASAAPAAPANSAAAVAASVGDAGELCSIAIRPSSRTGPPPTQLQIAEVELFGAGGVKIPLSAITPSLSTTLLWKDIMLRADFCNDGETRSWIWVPGTINVPNAGLGQLW